MHKYTNRYNLAESKYLKLHIYIYTYIRMCVCVAIYNYIYVYVHIDANVLHIKYSAFTAS